MQNNVQYQQLQIKNAKFIKNQDSIDQRLE